MNDSQSDGEDIKSPFNDFDLNLNSKPLIENSHSQKASLITSIGLKPTEQQRVPLGNYTDSTPPKGFSIEITPDPNPDGSVVTEVISLGTTKKYKLILQITNFGTGTIRADVWQL